MKLITVTEADAMFLSPMLEAGQYDFDQDPFPHMRASSQVLVFSEDYLEDVTKWWKAYLEATDFKYEPGSQMCEGGTKVFIGHVNEEAVQPFRGYGDVAPAIVAAAKAAGREIPTKRLGDFAAGAWEVRCIIPRGVSLNGVTDGGHSTPAIFVHDMDGNVYAVIWEWQNGRWVRVDIAIKSGVKIRDAID